MTDTVDVDYIANTIGYSRVTIYRWIRAGYLPTPTQTHPTLWPKTQNRPMAQRKIRARIGDPQIG